MKIYIKRGIVGFFVGATISYLLVISGIPALESVEMTLNGEFLRIHFLLTSLLGFHLAGSSAVFNQEEWSLLKQTIVHFLCMLPAIPAAYYLGWMPRTSLGAFTYVIVFLVLYAVQWILSYLYWKKQAKEMGEYLQVFQKNAKLSS
jgi:hypothetical protein